MKFLIILNNSNNLQEQNQILEKIISKNDPDIYVSIFSL
jgi:hypothetical protein